MNGRTGGSDRPEDVDAAFAEIVADLEREGLGSPERLAAELADTEDEAAGERDERPAAGEAPAGAPQAWRGHDAEWDWTWASDEEHYVPPEPPPLPRLRPMTIFALLLLVLGLLLLMVPGVIGLDLRVAAPISLIALACGGGLLLLRAKQNPPPPGDDGAQL